jgi:hypothetical protein
MAPYKPYKRTVVDGRHAGWHHHKRDANSDHEPPPYVDGERSRTFAATPRAPAEGFFIPRKDRRLHGYP